ncbi:MAG TPA: hypothetical protein GYA04_02475 [Acholeplasma sp.]|nr:hypothetical protein [Acholeplasma sp.]
MAFTFTHRGIKYTIPDSLYTGNKYNTGAIHNIINMVKYYIDHGKEPDDATMKSLEYERDYGKYEGNFADFMDTPVRLGSFRNIVTWMASEEGKKQIKSDNEGIYLDENGRPAINPETNKPFLESEYEERSTNDNEYNPYVHWLEQQRMNAESQELGLLNQQARASQQNAEISAQQAMIQQAQLRDQIIEQIKLDRMSKLRQGITPMQIANESLQFTVGNMLANNNQMTGINQARLAAIQQQGLNPYQAYLNSINSAGYQVQSNVASGMAATDASDMYMQALKYARSQGRNYILPEDYERVQGMLKQ